MYTALTLYGTYHKAEDAGDRPATSDERALRAGRWPKFDRYEITDGVVHPAAGARLMSLYDPWDEYITVWQRRQRPPRKRDDPAGAKRNNPRRLPPYEELLTLAKGLPHPYEPENGVPLMGEVEPTPDQRKRILAWCRHNGLLGLLHHETLEICLAPVWERDEGEEHLHAVAHVWRRSGARWVHGRLRYLHVHEKDTSILGEPVPPTRYGELHRVRTQGSRRGPQLTAEQAASMPKSLLETIDPAGGLIRRPLWGGGLEVAPLNGCWRDYFVARPEWQTPHWPQPSPHSEQFWRSYGEPLNAIVGAAEQLRWIMDVFAAQTPEHRRPIAVERRRLAAALDDLASFTANVWPRAILDEQGKPEVRWTAPSLIGSFALMIMFDLAGKGTIRTCVRCGTPFASSAPQAVYCSDRCRNAAQQTVFRAKHPKDG